MGTLYLVATPIGNLDDISARALRILREVHLIAAEDTRHTGCLLAHFGIATPLLSYHAHNERGRRQALLAALERGDVALVSDAGSPGVSDPAHDLVAAAHAAGHRVSPVPGPSATIAAATASGLVPGPFLALGFLPRRGPERRAVLARAAASGFPLVLFEAPGRVSDTLRDLARVLGEREAAVARELTKLHEEIRRGSLSSLATTFAAEPPRGEVVIVVGEAAQGEVEADDLERVVAGLLRSGMSPSHAAREAAALTGQPRSVVYELARRIKEREREEGPPGSGGG